MVLVFKDDKAIGWELIGDGTEPFMFEWSDATGIDDSFRAANKTLSGNHDKREEKGDGTGRKGSDRKPGEQGRAGQPGNAGAGELAGA